jgi:cobalt-zinc-cadmium efflux system outer membrane protein
MPRLKRRVLAGFLVMAGAAPAQTALTWEQVRERFRENNPTLAAGRLAVDTARATEITAHLRPNPQFNLLTDGTQIIPYQGVWRPFAGTMVSSGLSYLVERGNKRNLRFESAKQSTDIAASTYLDQERSLIFNLRNAFVQTLQAKSVLQLAMDNLSYYDQVLGVNRTRQQAGDIAQVDLDRLELERVRFETDFQTAAVNLRTAKIQLLALLNDRTPVEQFDIMGPFDFADTIMPLEEFRQMALEARPDLKAAMQAVDKAKTDHQLAFANGSVDPTLNAWYSRNPSFNNPFDNNTIGTNVTIPLRIHDRNQGEKLRTEIEIRRSEQLRTASQTQVFSDVDSAYATLNSNLTLLRAYKERYLQRAVTVRDTISFAYANGGASLLDFLTAQNDYRSTQLNYLNLVGSYLIASSQLNTAVGMEVIP